MKLNSRGVDTAGLLAGLDADPDTRWHNLEAALLGQPMPSP